MLCIRYTSNADGIDKRNITKGSVVIENGEGSGFVFKLISQLQLVLCSVFECN